MTLAAHASPGTLKVAKIATQEWLNSGEDDSAEDRVSGGHL